MSHHDEINDRVAGELVTHIDLSRIPGECIAAAMKGLPPAATATEPLHIDTDAPYGVGPVRLFFQVHRPQASQRRRGISPFWVCVRAERSHTTQLRGSATVKRGCPHVPQS